ncbi:hypothetical protein [Streptomyces sp. NPDC007991]|uniref:hypothetical protein n=1 Tax=Streptomyces sp. NPDC007991 TaxID=3364803 RepID=UPI0036E3A446
MSTPALRSIALCASEAARALSGRFLFALDDRRGNVAGPDADVTVRAAADGGAQLVLGAAGELGLAEGESPGAVGGRPTAGGIRHEWRSRETGRADGPRPGVVGDGLCVHVLLGRLSARQRRRPTYVAAGEQRLTPWRGVVLPTRGPRGRGTRPAAPRRRRTCGPTRPHPSTHSAGTACTTMSGPARLAAALAEITS